MLGEKYLDHSWFVSPSDMATDAEYALWTKKFYSSRLKFQEERWNVILHLPSSVVSLKSYIGVSTELCIKVVFLLSPAGIC